MLIKTKIKLNKFEVQVKNIVLTWRGMTDTNYFDLEEILEVLEEHPFYNERALPYNKVRFVLDVLIEEGLIKKISFDHYEIIRSKEVQKRSFGKQKLKEIEK